MKTSQFRHKSSQKGSMWDIFSYFQNDKYISDQIKQKFDKIEKQKSLSNFLEEQVMDLSAKKRVEDIRHNNYHQNMLRNADSQRKIQQSKYQKYIWKLEEIHRYNKSNIKDTKAISIFSNQRKSHDKQIIEEEVKDYNTQEHAKRVQLANLTKETKLQNLHQIELKKNSKQLEKDLNFFEDKQMFEHQDKLLERLENDQKDHMQKIIANDKSKLLKRSNNYSMQKIRSQILDDKLIDKQIKRLNKISEFKEKRDENLKQQRIKDL